MADAATNLLEPLALDAGPDWLRDLRRAGADAVRTHGLPGRRVEEWKYTRLTTLADTAFEPAHAPDMPESALPERPAFAVTRVVMINGVWDEDLSDAMPDGVTTLSAALAANAPLVRDTLTSNNNNDNNGEAFARHQVPQALNAAGLADGLVIDLADGTKLDKPVELLCITLPGAQPVMYHPRHVIRLGEGATATLIERHMGREGTSSLANAVTTAKLGDEARLNHYIWNAANSTATQINSITADVGDGGTYENFILNTGSALTRNQLHVRLGKGSHTEVNGASFLNRNIHADTWSMIEHVEPNATSNQTYRHVIDDTAHAVFQGKIKVHKDAQATDGYQMNRTLLLSDSAGIDAKPELEIWADDVKCSHGATMGRLDADQMFYLRARGVPQDEARRLLINAFIASGLADISCEDARGLFADALASVMEAQNG